MIKILKWLVGILVVLGLLVFFVGFPYMKSQTKKNSPEQTVALAETINGTTANLSVIYCKPYKKGREIFGGLVPFGKVWRTGANENTVFITDKDLIIGGNKLPAGKYSLFTIPEKDKWTVIWNKKQYAWGINYDQTSPRIPAEDALQIQVPVEIQTPSLDQFNISLAKNDNVVNMILAWDNTKVTVPIGF